MLLLQNQNRLNFFTWSQNTFLTMNPGHSPVPSATTTSDPPDSPSPEPDSCPDPSPPNGRAVQLDQSPVFHFGCLKKNNEFQDFISFCFILRYFILNDMKKSNSLSFKITFNVLALWKKEFISRLNFILFCHWQKWNNVFEN